MTHNIPLIIPNFNQVTYLSNLINWWRWYYPHNPIIVIDNGSTYRPLKDLYDVLDERIIKSPDNNCVNNLRLILSSDVLKKEFDIAQEHYCISDPDIMPLPSTPPNFLEIFKHCIDHYGFHHVGFGLKIDDIPDWVDNKQEIINNEYSFRNVPVEIEFEGKKYIGHRAPIDTTFAMYKKSNGGWANPQSGEAWSNSLRLFEAYHLPWYLNPQHLNDEMKNYFATAEYRIPGKTSTGKNNYRPKQFIEP